MKACGPCARAKVRCVRSSPGFGSTARTAVGPCDRCHRLDKDCDQQRISPRAPPVPRTRFGQLEKKVETLLQRLDQRQEAAVERPATLESPPVTTEVPRRSKRPQRHNVELSQVTASVLTPPQSTAYAQSSSYAEHSAATATANAAAGGPLWPQDEEADRLLDVYKGKLSGAFPFVVPLETWQALHLRHLRPYLFKALITAATYKDRDLQRRRGQDFLISLTHHMFVEGGKSLDILQSLLVHLAWYQCHIPRNGQMTNLLQLAIAALADLELNKPVHANDRRKLLFDAARSSYGFTSENKDMNNEERRALLACYYLSSTGSMVYRKIDALEYTPHMAEALQSLLAAEETPTDMLLAQLVRLQQIVHQINKVMPYDDPERPQCCGAPFIMHLVHLDQSLNDYQQSLPTVLQNHDFLLMHLHTARIFLYEVSLYESPWQGTSEGKRLDALVAFSQHLRSFFDAFFTFEEEAFLTFPYLLWAQLSHALLITSRLALLDYPGWNIEFAGTDLRLCEVLKRTTAKLEAANRYAKANWVPGGDLIAEKILMKMAWVRSWFTDFVQTPARSAVYGRQVASPPQGFWQDVDGQFLADDGFWEQIMGGSEMMPYS